MIASASRVSRINFLIDTFAARGSVTLWVDRRATALIVVADPIDHPGQFMTCPLGSGPLPDAELLD
jgi:hypothetical protein